MKRSAPLSAFLLIFLLGCMERSSSSSAPTSKPAAVVQSEKVVETSEMKPVKSVAEARELIDSYQGDVAAFTLAVPHSMVFDEMGINMAVITDRVLAREWEPDGFEDRGDVRIFRYKLLAPESP